MNSKQYLQHLYSYVRKAIEEFNMIDEGDKIAIGISGGKDSLTLLYALKGIQRFYPKKFDLMAVTVDLGLEGFDTTPIKKLCDELEVPYLVVKTEIAQIIFNDRKEKHPCSLCAKMRKGALNNAVLEHGYNKVAYAHHKDDVVETMLMSLLYEGRFHSFPPKTNLEGKEICVIRPMIYINEADIKGFEKKFNLPVQTNKKVCPADGYTKREYAKDLLKQLNHENPGCKERMFSAILNGNLEDWPSIIKQ